MYLYGKKFVRYSLMHSSNFVFITSLKIKSFSLIPPIRTKICLFLECQNYPRFAFSFPVPQAISHTTQIYKIPTICASHDHFLTLCGSSQSLGFSSSLILSLRLDFVTVSQISLLPTPLILVYAKSHGQRSLVGLSMGLQRAGHDWATEQSTHMFINYLQNPYPGLLLWSTFSALISRELNLPKNNHINLDIDHYRNMVSGLISHCNMVPISVYFPSVFKE